MAATWPPFVFADSTVMLNRIISEGNQRSLVFYTRKYYFLFHHFKVDDVIIFDAAVTK